MKVTKLLKGEEARTKIKAGIDLVADYTKITLGPKGRNVALKKYGPLPPRVVNDGVTIAKEVKSEDPFIQVGVEMVQEICAKTNDNAGDGTTQTALLAQAIISEGYKVLSLDSTINAVDLKNEIEADTSQLIDVLTGFSHPVENTETIRNLATISGNNDQSIGDAMAEVMSKVGMNASIIIERGNEEKIRVETIKGMYFDKGYRSPYFVNVFEKGTAELKNPAIFIVDSFIKWDDEILTTFEQMVKNLRDKAEVTRKMNNEQSMNVDFKNVIIIANEIEGEALNTLAQTNMAKYDKTKDFDFYFNIVAIEAPYFGANRSDFLQDLAVYTGGKVLQKLTDIEYNDVVGTCEKIICNSKTTTIIGGAGDDELKLNKLNEIKNLVDQLDSAEKTHKEFLEKRRDVMESGVGVIFSGGSTEIEMKDRYLRIEDAVRASKSAVKEGYVSGGGVTYLKLSKLARSPIMAKALRSVVTQVLLNAGKHPESIIDQIENNPDDIQEFGYNAKTSLFGNMVDFGVIDATLVLKNALQNASSLACSFFLTEAVSTEEEVEKKADFNKGL